MWRVGKRELIAMGLGLLVYGVLLYAVLTYETPLDPLWGEAVTSLLYYGEVGYPLLGAIATGCTFALPFFLGLEFGPWAGLVCALGGRVLAEQLLLHLPMYTLAIPPWPGQYTIRYVFVYAIWSLFGFLPGLVSGYRKKLRDDAYRQVSPGQVSLLVGAGTLLIVFLLFYGLDYLTNDNPHSSVPIIWSSDMLYIICSSLSALVTLALLLGFVEAGAALYSRWRAARAKK